MRLDQFRTTLLRHAIRAGLTLLVVAGISFHAFGDHVVKVYVLAGQSNMEGKGHSHHLDTYKDDPLIQPWYDKIKDGEKWAVRDDVFITYPVKKGALTHGPLTVGYGTKGQASIGPEFGFGHAIGELTKEPVLLIKVAWGGRSVFQDFRPPSAIPTDAEFEQMVIDAQERYDQAVVANKTRQEQGKKIKPPKPVPTIEELKERFGAHYRLLVKYVQEELDGFEAKFPELKGHQPQLAGLIWHQGFNDMVRKGYLPTKYADYTKWVAMLIHDLREEWNAPELPVVIGELGAGGLPSRGDFQAAQAGVAKLPELRGNVKFVPTAQYYDTVAQDYFQKGYWKGTEEQKALWKSVAGDRPYHYLGSGKTYFLKGVAFANAVNDLSTSQ